MRLSLPERSTLVSAFWKDAPPLCPRHDIPMRSFFVERVYKPQIVMVCPKGEMFRFDQKPKQIAFSKPHVKTMVLDSQEREAPACPQDFTTLVVYRTPAKFLPVGWDYTFLCPNCLSYGQWVDTGRPEEEVAAAPKPKKEAPAFHDETIPLPKRMEMARDGNLALKLYAAMAQTDCTACGYDCEGYAAALAAGTERDPNLCVPGKEETLKIVKDLLKGTGLPAASG
ncbi:MAG: (Fe-S)-binding protein [Thermoanaerobaculia bacterium]